MIEIDYLTEEQTSTVLEQLTSEHALMLRGIFHDGELVAVATTAEDGVLLGLANAYNKLSREG